MGAARYNTAAQLEALVYRENFPNDAQSVLFTNWAMGQMNYLMGDNPADWSYIVGFGSTTPSVGSEVGGTATAASHPHHGDAQGSLTNSQSDPPTDEHVLWGALVGGPSSTDEPDDVTTDFVLNEVAVDYNAAFVGALAGLYQYYGQSQNRPLSATVVRLGRRLVGPRGGHRRHPEPDLPVELRDHDADERLLVQRL